MSEEAPEKEGVLDKIKDALAGSEKGPAADVLPDDRLRSLESNEGLSDEDPLIGSGAVSYGDTALSSGERRDDDEPADYQET